VRMFFLAAGGQENQDCRGKGKAQESHAAPQ
jgi:hypothetical protein